MIDISLQKTAKTAKRIRGRPFPKGQSGNPAGRPRGSSNRAMRAAELLLDGEAAALTRKAVELALAGNQAALRLCLDRTVAQHVLPADQRHRDQAAARILPGSARQSGPEDSVPQAARAQKQVVRGWRAPSPRVLSLWVKAVENWVGHAACM